VNGRDCGAEISAAGKRLLSLHVSNNDGLSDKHWMPDRGVLDWQLIKKHLARIHYPAEYVLEVRGGEDPDSVLAQLQEFVRVDSQL
jgi:sugar phosphate isomerase/epimerase